MTPPGRQPDARDSPPQRLLAWYDAERRDLPWRRHRGRYPIWLSEVMLQQTRVDTVVNYYLPFLDRFPNVATLAAASEDEVLAAWSGLGYYRRARLMHQAAKEVARRGQWPTGSAGWRQLPGIGEYTAAALASIVDGERIAVLDGNVERVTARLVAAGGEVRSKTTRGRLQRVAEQLLTDLRPGDGNQALMELGATICRPVHPSCHLCPLSAGCAGFAAGEPERFPRPRRRKATERVERHLFVNRDGAGRFTLFRRPADRSTLAGFWEFPAIDDPPEEGAGTQFEAELASRLEAVYGGRWRIGPERGTVSHSITHRRYRVTVYEATVVDATIAESTAEGIGEGRFCSAHEIDALPTSSLTRKVLALFG